MGTIIGGIKRESKLFTESEVNDLVTLIKKENEELTVKNIELTEKVSSLSEVNEELNKNVVELNSQIEDLSKKTDKDKKSEKE